MNPPDPYLVNWLESTFRNAVNDDDRVLKAAAILKVAVENGDNSVVALRHCIAAFVLDLIDPGIDVGPEWYRRN